MTEVHRSSSSAVYRLRASVDVDSLTAPNCANGSHSTPLYSIHIHIHFFTINDDYDDYDDEEADQSLK